MRLPQPLLDSVFFQFSTVAEVLRAVDGLVSDPEKIEIERLAGAGLPPITSAATLSALLGINPGLVYSFVSRPSRHYRTFEIPKGNTTRLIHAPRVALKVVQKWISTSLQKNYRRPNHVFGFIPGLSHVDAAAKHCNAEWVFNIDLKNFFSSTPKIFVAKSLMSLGFNPDGAALIASLCCLNNALAQGAPSSPVLSNICFSDLDRELSRVATTHQVRLTRYADDIVFSGAGSFPEDLKTDVLVLFEESVWKVAEKKTTISELPHRLKVHGLLVHGNSVRLTKGYRNRIRAYKHLLAAERIRAEDVPKVNGHIHYEAFVKRVADQALPRTEPSQP